MAGVDTHNSPALEPQTQWLSWARAYLLQGCQPVVPQRLGSAACARIGNVLEGERDVEFRVSDRSCYDAESEDEGISSEDESISFDGSSGECPICLGTRGAGTTKVALRCSHVFCQDCLDQHIATALSAGRNAWCPLCREPLDSADLPMAAVAVANSSNNDDDDDDDGSLPPPPLNPRAERREARQFRRAARRAHLKRCPSCNAAIEKNEGCDHMICACGHHFSWDAAEAVAPCTCLNMDTFWGSTCEGCSKRAKVKLCAYRAATATIGIPTAAAAGAVAGAVAGTAVVAAGVAGTAVTAVGLSSAAVVAAVPAVVCAPMAAVYEPVRRLRKKSANPFKEHMGDGARLVAMGAFALCNDSD